MTAALENPNAEKTIAQVFDERQRRPLTPLLVIRVLALLDEDQALELIETGKIRHAYNIADKQASRAEWRVLWQDALAIVCGRECQERNFADVLSFIFPRPSKVEGADTVRVSTVYRAFLCSSGLVQTHIANGDLRLAFPSRKYGPSESPHVLFSSVIDFLQRRAFGA